LINFINIWILPNPLQSGLHPRSKNHHKKSKTMLTKRIIPCLDVKDGMTVKGINFEGLRPAGDAVELAERYALDGADELVFLDITATLEGRNTFTDMVRSCARVLNIPFTVGGGIRAVEDVSRLLNAGADKASVNSSAVKNPALITELANEFGSQCVVVAIDVKQLQDGGDWNVVINAGKQPTNWEAVRWAKEVESLGAGEILLTSMNNDGTKSGFALEITRAIAQSVGIPVIASGGAGTMQHFADVLGTKDNDGWADAALAASLFHFGELTVPQVKHFLSERGIAMRL
jgi:imidazole glycerol-phosphate synthase subunit HisF